MRTYSIVVLTVVFWLVARADAVAEERVALVIGNSAYRVASALGNARRDAEAVSDKLRALGFDVVEVFDADGRATTRAITNFKAKARAAELILVYFAGHGVQLFGENFLLSTDFSPERIASRADTGLQLSDLVAEFRGISKKRMIVLVDACRNNPLGADAEAKLLVNGAKVLGRSTSALPTRLRQGLAQLDVAQSDVDAGESLFMFSAQPGKVASDGSGQNSPFAEALLAELGRADRDVVSIFAGVSRYVFETTKGEQRPELRMSWTTSDYRLSAMDQRRRAINFSLSETKQGDALYEKNIDALTNFYRPTHLTGPFLLSASLPMNISADDWRYIERSKRTGFSPIGAGLGHLNAFEMTFDFDGDGVEEGLLVRNGQVGVEFYIRKGGWLHRFEPICPVTDALPNGYLEGEVEAVDVGILDINANRRPEIWIVRHRTDQAWPDLCVVEYSGKYTRPADVAWGSTSALFDPGLIIPLLSQTAGWSVTVSPDKNVEICAGSYCGNRWAISWDGSQFVTKEWGGASTRHARLDWPAAAVANWGGAYTGPRPPKPSGATSMAALIAEMARFVESEYLAERAVYADRVDFFDKGFVDKVTILKEQRDYASKWPERSFRLVENSVRLLERSGDRVKIAFEHQFTVGRPGKSVSGGGQVQLQVVRSGGRWVIHSVKEKVVKR